MDSLNIKASLGYIERGSKKGEAMGGVGKQEEEEVKGGGRKEKDGGEREGERKINSRKS